MEPSGLRMSVEGEQGLAFFDLLTLEAVNVGNDSRHRRCDAGGGRGFARHSRLRLDRAVCRHAVAQRRQRNLSDVDGDFRFALSPPVPLGDAEPLCARARTSHIQRLPKCIT